MLSANVIMYIYFMERYTNAPYSLFHPIPYVVQEGKRPALPSIEELGINEEIRQVSLQHAHTPVCAIYLQRK